MYFYFRKTKNYMISYGHIYTFNFYLIFIHYKNKKKYSYKRVILSRNNIFFGLCRKYQKPKIYTIKYDVKKYISFINKFLKNTFYIFHC